MSKSGAFRILPLLISASVRRRPAFLQIHGGRWSSIKKSFLARQAWRFSFYLSAGIGVFPGDQWDELEKIQEIKFKMYPIKNFVEPKKFGNNLSEELNFIFVGRLVEEKGVKELLSAFLRLRDENGERVRLTILGSGPLYDYVKSFSGSGIVAPGFVVEEVLDDYMKNSNVFVLPSYHEGFPLSFLEAGARGIVPIVTASSAIPSFFESDVECIFVFPEDVESLYSAMKSIIEDPAKRQAMAKAIYTRVNNEFVLGSKPVKDQFINIYSKMSKGKGV